MPRELGDVGRRGRWDGVFAVGPEGERRPPSADSNKERDACGRSGSHRFGVHSGADGRATFSLSMGTKVPCANLGTDQTSAKPSVA